MIGIIKTLKKFINPGILKETAAPAIKIIYTGASLFILLLVIRTSIVDIKLKSGLSLLTFIPKAFISAYHDFSFVLALTFLFGLLLFLLKNKQKYHVHLYHLYIVAALFTLITSVLNQRTISVIGNPFSYQWLYYSDFMGSQDASNAMLSNISWELFALTGLICSLMFLLAKLFTIFHNYITRSKVVRFKIRLLLLAGIFLIFYSSIFNWYKDYQGWQYNQLANPITFFMQSALKTDKNNLLFSMEVPVEFDDLPPSKKQVNTLLFNDNSHQAKIKNVLVFVLESVPAEYLDAYGGKYGVTPEINKLIPNSVRFENTYAHSPATNNSMVSILGSIYPWISYKSLTKENPEIKLNSISTLLKQKNYRTAFYTAGDLKFQRGDEFLLNQQFDKVEDFSSELCREKQFIVKGKRWENPDGADDECMVESFSEWIDADIKRPFFATLWTVQTHYPYFYSGKEKDYHVNNPDFNRYLNALQHSDQVLGKLMNALKKRGLEESTLIVIVGDHGEAFGKHKQFTHASKIYEENIHVPLILVNKNLFHGECNDIISGHIDIAPTIMDLLKLPVDERWQGQNLFNGQRNNRTYFFAPWSDFLFGFRENNLKFIYNATKNSTEVYDLEKDPAEAVNLADQLPPDFLDKGLKRLAQWIQYQDKFIKTSINK